MTAQELQVGKTYAFKGFIKNMNFELELVEIQFKLTRRTVISSTVTTEYMQDTAFKYKSDTTIHSIEMCGVTASGEQLLFNHVLYNHNKHKHTAEIYWNCNLLTPVSKDVTIDFDLYEVRMV